MYKLLLFSLFVTQILTQCSNSILKNPQYQLKNPLSSPKKLEDAQYCKFLIEKNSCCDKDDIDLLEKSITDMKDKLLEDLKARDLRFERSMKSILDMRNNVKTILDIAIDLNNTYKFALMSNSSLVTTTSNTRILESQLNSTSFYDINDANDWSNVTDEFIDFKDLVTNANNINARLEDPITFYDAFLQTTNGKHLLRSNLDKNFNDLTNTINANSKGIAFLMKKRKKCLSYLLDLEAKIRCQGCIPDQTDLLFSHTTCEEIGENCYDYYKFNIGNIGNEDNCEFWEEEVKIQNQHISEMNHSLIRIKAELLEAKNTSNANLTRQAVHEILDLVFALKEATVYATPSTAFKATGRRALNPVNPLIFKDYTVEFSCISAKKCLPLCVAITKQYGIQFSQGKDPGRKFITSSNPFSAGTRILAEMSDDILDCDKLDCVRYSNKGIEIQKIESGVSSNATNIIENQSNYDFQIDLVIEFNSSSNKMIETFVIFVLILFFTY